MIPARLVVVSDLVSMVFLFRLSMWWCSVVESVRVYRFLVLVRCRAVGVLESRFLGAQ